MNDDQVRDYLRGRARVEPPHDFIGAVLSAVADAPQRRAAWFAPFVPAAVAIGTLTVVTAVVVLVSQVANVGPPPDPSASALVSTLPSPPTTSEPLASLDGRIEFAASDPDGEYGRISVLRGADSAGYPHSPVDQDDLFFVELYMTYSLERLPEPARWGRSNWSVRAVSGDGTSLNGAQLAPEDLGPEAPRPIIASWPGAMEPELRNYEGWLLIQVPRVLADAWVYIDYTPTGADVREASYLVRSPRSAPPETALPPPTPPPTYVTQDGLELSVIESREADELFSTPDTCTNPEGGYTVTYPDDWYTNTAFGTVQPCTWFSPDFFEVDDLTLVPDEIAIVLSSFRGGVGSFYEPNYVLTEPVTVAGYKGTRTEEAGGFWADETLAPSARTYAYLIFIGQGQDVDQRWISGSTSNEMGGDYLLNKAVFDRIMANLVVSEPTLAPSTFTPEPNAEADALFAARDACINASDKYTIEYPASWYTNVAGNPAAADPAAECTHFQPEPIEEGVISAITGSRTTGPLAEIDEAIDRQSHTIAGRPAERIEYRAGAGDPPPLRYLVWHVLLGVDWETGPYLVFATSFEDAVTYELSGAVLDRMMLSLRVAE